MLVSWSSGPRTVSTVESLATSSTTLSTKSIAESSSPPMIASADRVASDAGNRVSAEKKVSAAAASSPRVPG